MAEGFPRIRRLEDVLGARLADVDEASLRRLVAGGIREDTDLEYKSALYGGSDGDKRAFCIDVAAIANTRDGILVLGVSETDGAAADLAPLPLSDAEELRMRGLLLSGVDPTPAVHIRQIPSSAADGQGYYLVVVPRSPDAPHAVRVSDGYRYPRRFGTRTHYLTESEIADAYRDKFRGERLRVERLDQVRAEGCAAIDTSDELWLAVALVPASPGHFEVRQRTVRETRDTWVGRWSSGALSRALLVSGFSTYAGVGRVVVSTGTRESNGLSTYSHAELHADGSAFIARQAFGGKLTAHDDTPSPTYVDDETLITATVAVLAAVADHATVAAGAVGDAIVQLSILGIGPEGCGLAHARQWGHPRPFSGTRVVPAVPASRHTLSLGDLASAGPSLLVAARTMLTDVFQAFGYPEVPQITENGEIRLPYVAKSNTPELTAWASRNGVATVETTVEDEP